MEGRASEGASAVLLRPTCDVNEERSGVCVCVDSEIRRTDRDGVGRKARLGSEVEGRVMALIEIGLTPKNQNQP